MTTRRHIAGLLMIGFLATASLAAQEPDTTTGILGTTEASPDTTTPQTAEISFNFRGATIDTVLDYLSEAAGFAVVTTVPLSGTIDVISHRPLNPEESLELVTTILHEKGYAALRSGNTLTIVSREDAKQRDIPVRQGSDPLTIPKNDEMVTQIIPIRYSQASELVENLRPLLPSYSTISANEGSNAILLTDTQANIRRVAEIITALDKSFSEITTVKVFQLRHADAKETATLITELFEQETTSGSSSNSRQLPPFFRRGGDDGDRQSSSSTQNAVVQASSRVTATADERTNSLVVAAPPQLITTIEELIATLDLSTEILTEVRVFPLKYADAEEMADVITEIFAADSTTQSTTNSRSNVRIGFRGPGGRAPGGNTVSNSEQSEREQESATVLAVADTRTNSVVVSAVSDVLTQIAGVVHELDRDPAGTKKVYVYSLKNANPEEVSELLDEMFGSTSSSSSSRTSTSNTSSRNTTNTTNTNRNTNTTNR
ncbi:MAG: ral secretion pathway protein [Candidatus Sumerlaeota bacterium]|nr:ral secretion pathway protein [Candidatus Sumerlaeota bacterium]